MVLRVFMMVVVAGGKKKEVVYQKCVWISYDLITFIVRLMDSIVQNLEVKIYVV
jgi:hypothetical protein